MNFDPYLIDDSVLEQDLYGDVRVLGGAGSGNFGHAGRPGEVGGSVGVYHGTLKHNLDSIMKEGLSASRSGTVWPGESKPGYVYLTQEIRDAKHWARAAADVPASGPGDLIPVVIKVVIPGREAVRLERDYHFAKDDVVTDTFQFQGDIKPEWIKEAWVEPPPDGKDDDKTWIKVLAANAVAGDLILYVPFALVIEKQVRNPRYAARRSEGPLHKAADAHVAKLSVVFRYAFAVARKAIRPVLTEAGLGQPGLAQDVSNQAVAAMIEALARTLPRTVHMVVLAGGRVGMDELGKRLRVAGLRTLKDTFRRGPFTMRFDVASPEAIAWADRHAAELIDGISETTREAISNAVAEALEEGDLRGMYDEILEAVGNEERAELIARTEVMTAANEGLRQSWRQAVDGGLLTGEEKRTWIATGDESTCPVCADLDGTVADLDGEYPEPGGEGPPAHPRCRCTEGLT